MGGSWRRIALGYTLAMGIATLFAVSTASALAIPPTPPLNRPIVDQAHVLSTSDVDALAAKIAASRAKKDYQMGILVIPTLGNDESLEGYSLDVARQWGIGTAEKDNGVLLLVVINDRKVRIEVGRGLEGDLTDVESGRIIRNVIGPEFRKGDYAAGIGMALDSITAQVEGIADPNQGTMDAPVKDFDPTVLLFMGFWVLPWLGSILARSRSWWAGGVIGGGLGVGLAGILGWALWALIGAGVLTIVGLLFDFFVSRNYRTRVSQGENPAWWAGGTYWGGGSGGGFSGGGGSFGGGGFSGGGSSGSW